MTGVTNVKAQYQNQNHSQKDGSFDRVSGQHNRLLNHADRQRNKNLHILGVPYYCLLLNIAK